MQSGFPNIAIGRLAVVLLGGVAPLFAQTPPSLGAARSFAILGGSAITNSGPTTVVGNVGVSPGTTITGLSRENLILGDIVTGALVEQAQKDNAANWNDLATRTCSGPAANPAGTLLPGVYCLPSPALVTGLLTLDAAGNRDAVWIFKTAGALVAAPGASVLLINGGRDGNVFWQTGSATLDERSRFAGTILALTNITMNHRASISGRLLSQTGIVTLHDNSVTICCELVTLSPTSLPGGTVGVPYEQTLTASGGSPPYTIRKIAGAFPDGLALSAGTIAGKPTKAGTFKATVAAVDSDLVSCIRDYIIDICSVITLTPEELPPVKTCERYSETITADGGSPPYMFSVSSGTLLEGLTLSTAGVLSGRVAAGTTCTVTVTATDSLGCSGSRIYTIRVIPVPVTISPETLPGGMVGEIYDVPITVTPPGDYEIRVTGLPAGLAPLITGIPLVAGLFTIDVVVFDNVSKCVADTHSYRLRIRPVPVIIPPIQPGKLCVPYSHTIVSPPLTITSYIGSLPRGLTLSGDTLSGTPAEAGSFPVTLRIADADVPVVIVIDPTTIVLSSVVLTPAIVGLEFKQVITASGAIPPYSFEVGPGLPPNLKLMQTGDDTAEISGIPQATGSSIYTVTATTSVCSGSATYQLTVTNCPFIAITPPALPHGTAGTPYSVTLTPSAGVAPYDFTVAAGALPPGLTLSTSGVLSGTPTTPGVYSIRVHFTDASGCPADVEYCTFDISPAGCAGTTITLAPDALAPAAIGPYAAMISASGGTAPYTFSVTAGSLPPGLTLNSVTGVISGIYTTNSGEFTITATDANGCIGSRCYMIRPVGNAPSLSEWGMLLLALLLAAAACVALGRLSV